jgi:hypothetical protein
MNKSFRKPIQVNITVEEYDLLCKINEHEHISNIEIFRRGLLSYADHYKISLTKSDVVV